MSATFITARQIARQYAVPAATLRGWVIDGMPRFRVGRRDLYRAADVEARIVDCRVGSPKEAADRADLAIAVACQSAGVERKQRRKPAT